MKFLYDTEQKQLTIFGADEIEKNVIEILATIMRHGDICELSWDSHDLLKFDISIGGAIEKRVQNISCSSLGALVFSLHSADSNNQESVVAFSKFMLYTSGPSQHGKYEVIYLWAGEIPSEDSEDEDIGLTTLVFGHV